MLDGIKNTKLDDLGISLADNILEIGVYDEAADRMAVDYIAKTKAAKEDKSSLIYKSCLIKQNYKNSDLHKSINRLIGKIEPLRLLIKRETLDMKEAVAIGNKKAETEIINRVAQKKLEHSKLEKQLEELMRRAEKLQLAS